MRSFFSPFRLATIGVVLGTAGLMAQAPAAKPAAKPATATPAQSAAADPIVITVGVEHIRASQFSALIKAMPPESQAAMLANKRAVADDLGKMMALDQEAIRLGLDQNPQFKAQMMLARDNALAKSVVDKLQAQSTPTAVQIQAYYTAHTAQFQQTKLRHILIGDSETPNGPNPRTQAEALVKANQLSARLKNGEDFAAIAKAESDDPGSKSSGGELGEMSPGQTVPEFETAVVALPIGKISDPIHTRFGYHIVEVEARSTMPLDQAKPIIVEQLTGDSVNSAMDKIAAAAHIDVNESYFGPVQPAAPDSTPHQ